MKLPIRLSGAANSVQWPIPLVIAFSITLGPVGQPQDPPGAALDRQEVPAAGRQSSYLTVQDFGRYSLRAESAEGTALQLVDRMAGPGPLRGSAGQEDGRLDAFLDRGRYKVVTLGHDKAQGTARLKVDAFREVQPAPVQLLELKPVQAELQDLEQLSYWMVIERRRRVALEAAGRSLADLRLWKDGTWLLDAAPSLEVVEPRPGQPLQVCRLVADLNPGLYRLTAYAGPSQLWAEQSDAHPFHLRWEIPYRAEASRSAHVLSEFGIDRWIVPSTANFIRLEVPEAAPLQMTVARLAPDSPFQDSGQRLEINRQTVPPAVQATLPPSKQSRLVTIRGRAGQPYLLQHFFTKDFYELKGSGTYWVSTVHAGAAEDSVDATGVLTSGTRLVAVKALEIGPSQGWRRRFNLLERTTLHVSISQSGSYVVQAEGARLECRFEPFFISPPRDYQAPPLQPAGTDWELEKGLYVLTLVPRGKGIVTLGIRPSPGLIDSVLQWAGLGSEDAGLAATTGSLIFGPMQLDQKRSYRLDLNRQPGVTSGLVLRPLPLDLSQALPLTPKPGEVIEVPFQAANRQQVRAQSDSGEELEVSLDGGPWTRQTLAAPGRHSLRVRNTGDRTAVCSLQATSLAGLPSEPLPDLPQQRLQGLDLPLLSPRQTAYFDLGRQQQASYRVEVPESGLYRLETLGLLQTSGNLRTRTIPVLFQESSNGIGRNFLIQQYLGAGSYQITVQSQGRSMGHLGLRLKRGEVLQGGGLAVDLAARAALPADRALVYNLEIAQEDEYCLSSLGLQRMHRFRLEDAEGFPLEAAEHQQPVCRRFAPGSYRMVLLPEAFETRRVTLLERHPAPPQLAGRGPHRLPFDQKLEKLWMEPDEGQPRRSDLWEFELPAPAEVRLELGGEMQGRLFREGERLPRAEVPPTRGWKGDLPAGNYRLEVTALRRNNRAPYQLSAHPAQLVAGLARLVTAPASIPVSLGNHPAVEFHSLGSEDVSARLYDSQGSLVAQSDDRPDDWNFHILRSLPAGAYTLQVDPVASEQAYCRVYMEVPETVEEKPLGLPGQRSLELGRETRLFPLRLDRQSELLLLRAEAPQSVAMALEALSQGSWRVLAQAEGRAARLEIPLPADGRAGLRLRLWSLDGRPHAVQLNGAGLRPQPAGEDALAAGAALVAVKGFPAAALAVNLPRGGLFRFSESASGLRFCPQLGEPCRPLQEFSPVAGNRLWLVGDAAGTLSGHRAALQAGEELAFQLSADWPVRVDLALGAGGPSAVLARTTGGRPGILLAPPAGLSNPGLSALRMASDERAALTVSSGRAGSALLWTAQPSGSPLDLRLSRIDFALAPTEPLGWGQWSGSLDGNSVRGFEVPPSSKRLRLVLGEGVAAALFRGQELLSVHWRQGTALSETLEAQADRLLLLNLRTSPVAAALEAFPLPQAAPIALTAESPLERSFPAAGVLRLDVPPLSDLPPSARIRLRGASEEAVLLGADGQVRTGFDLSAPPQGGTLLIPHGAEWLLAFIDPDGNGSLAVPSQGLPEMDARLPEILTLQGAAQTWRLDLPEASLLQLRAPTPLVLRWQRPEGAASVELLAQGGSSRIYLPSGLSRLSLRALGGGELRGSAELISSPVTPIGEGLGPEVLLAPGSSRLFSFQVQRSGEVGIGVRAGSDVVQAQLLSPSGDLLAEGVVQMVRLEPGTYLLSLTAPAWTSPVTARPAVVGIELPPESPPQEVIQKYLQAAEEPNQK